MSEVEGQEVEGLRRELGTLRAENARLSRLLELGGWDTVPAAEQLAVPGRPGLVTMASSSVEKLALYADLFGARTDVYARYWENLRAGTHGWVPVVRGWWRKGMDRRSASYLPLTRDVVTSHLADDDLFIGLYPLMRDSSCRFLVADFDGPAAMLDALAYAKAARAEGVPAAVELSKSGRGAHVWVFFAAAVAAVTARLLGTALLHKAMVLRVARQDRAVPRCETRPVRRGPEEVVREGRHRLVAVARSSC